MKRRSYRRRTQCDGKMRHLTRSAAEAHRDRLYAAGRAELDIYRCRHCGALHVGRHHKTR